FHPALSPFIKSTIAFEYKHFELTQLPFRKHLHIGFQIEHVKEIYFWAGVYQLYPTFGLGWRVKGGNFELTSYAAEIGDGDINRADRRLTFRYTIGF
ncbi:MAG: hypothetical protein ACKOA8_05635, partial [Deltaproteobacteria bacterium]